MFVCIVVGYRSILKIWFRISQTSANKFLRAFWMIYTPCVWKEISGNRKRNLIRKGKISKTVSSLIVHFVRAERCIRESFEGKSSRIIPSGVRDRLRKWHIVKSDGESSDARGSRLTDSSDVGWMVLDVIAREITRRFERAHLSPPRHLPLFPPSLTLPPSPLHNLFLLQRCTAISPTTTRTFLQRLLERRAFLLPLDIQPLLLPPTAGEPLRNRREPALISHLPLFFISDIRIYHRDPAGTPLERAEGGGGGGGGGRNESRRERSDTG